MSGILFGVLAAFLLVGLAGLGWLALSLGRDAVKSTAALSSPRAFASLVKDQGWTYQESDPTLAKRWRGYPFESPGGGSQGSEARNVLRATLQGHDVTMFQYIPPRPGAAEATPLSIWAVRLPQALPDIGVAPDGSNNIHADSQQYAESLLTSKVRELLSKPQEVAWRIEGDYLLSWQQGASKHKPRNLLTHAGLLIQVAENISPGTWQQYGIRATP